MGTLTKSQRKALEALQTASPAWITHRQADVQERVMHSLCEKGLAEYVLEVGLGRAVPTFRLSQGADQ